MAVGLGPTVYFAASDHHVIFKLGPNDLNGSVVTGKFDEPNYRDGIGSEARFDRPEGLAIGDNGGIYIADANNRAIRWLSPEGAVSTLAGKRDDLAFRNGRGLFARFGRPETLALSPRGDLYLGDRGSRRIRRLSRDGSVFLVAGSGHDASTDGPGHLAAFRAPRYLTMDEPGRLYIRDLTDTGDEVIRKIERD